mmetsp:Transcript_72337/g.172761  ORF Transcript_72337/g.172761 Transcript_72337/m.172761 type:complete len:273 (+) Transcript_72337:135-953(+)
MYLDGLSKQTKQEGTKVLRSSLACNLSPLPESLRGGRSPLYSLPFAMPREPLARPLDCPRWKRSSSLPRTLFLAIARRSLLTVCKLATTLHRSWARRVSGIGEVIAASATHMNAAPRIGFAVGPEVTNSVGGEKSERTRKSSMLLMMPRMKLPGLKSSSRTPAKSTWRIRSLGVATNSSMARSKGASTSSIPTQNGWTADHRTPVLPASPSPGPSALWTPKVRALRTQVELAIRSSKLLRDVKLSSSMDETSTSPGISSKLFSSCVSWMPRR